MVNGEWSLKGGFALNSEWGMVFKRRLRAEW